MEIVGYALSIVVGLLILVFLIVIHELGHGIVARRNGVKVEEFGVGFPPAAKSKTIARSILGKNVVYSLNWLPIGGFVKLQGEYDSAHKKGDYGAATFWQKTRILLAGVGMNWLAAAVLFTILSWVGMPKLLANQFHVASDTTVTRHPLLVESVTPESPAAKIGLQPGDQIISINHDESLADIALAPQTTKQFAGRTITLDYMRGSQRTTTDVLLNTPDQAQHGYLGVTFGQDQTTYRSTWSAPINGVGLTAQLSWETLKGVGGLLQKLVTGLAGLVTTDGGARAKAAEQIGDTGNSVAGPIGIVFKLLPGAVGAGLVPIMLLSAIISLTLAVMNVLPIPALDGGRWYLMAIYKLLKKPLTKETEEKINSAGMMALLGLFALITIADVMKLF